MTEHRYIGRSPQRGDGRDKVRGRFDYLADGAYDKALYGAHLTSTTAHGELVSIDVSRALALPGVRCVFTPDDVPDTKINTGEWFPGQNDHPDETLLTRHARHIGDRIALVLADDLATARRAAALIETEFCALPPVVTIDEALASGGLHDDDARFDFAFRFGDGEKKPTGDCVVVESRSSTQKIHHAAMEPHAVVARPMPGGAIEIETPCQIAFGVQHAVSLVVGIPLSKIRVKKAHMGGTFGGKQEVVYEAICAWAAWKTGRPVVIAITREECMLSTRTRAASRCEMATTFERGGTIISRRIDLTVDAGAYITGAKKILAAMAKKTSRIYRIPAITLTGRAVRTSTVPSGACRGYGSPQIALHSEINMDFAAKRLGIDPVELRLKNLVHPYDDDPSGGPNLGNARVVDCLEAGARAFQWSEKTAPRSRGRFRIGSGCACATHGNGYLGSVYHDFTAMSMRMFEDGSIVLRGTFFELGNDTLTAMAQIVAEATGVPPERITVTEADTTAGHYDIGCQASRVVYVCGECARLTADAMMDLLKKNTAELLGAPPESLIVNGGFIANPASGEKISYSDAVRRSERERNRSIDVFREHRPQHNPASYGVNFATVEVDTKTGLVRVLELLAVHDVGRVIHRASIEGQIYGGVQMGIGMALTEDIPYDAKGRPGCDNFDRYHMISAVDMPDVRVILIEDGEPGGPYGAKSIGEIATVPTAPAVVNAVNRALGTELADLPLTPAKIVAAL